MGRKGCSCTKKTGGGGKVWVVRGAAALRRLAVVARYGRKGCSCTKKTGGIGKVWVVRGAAALRRLAVVARYGS